MNDHPNPFENLEPETELIASDPNLYLFDEKASRENDQAFKTQIQEIPPPIGEAAFIGPLAHWIEEIEPQTECSRDNLLAQGLTIWSAMAGRSRYSYLEKELYANLFSIILGSSALARKGTALGHAKRFLQEQINPEWRGIIDNWQSGEALVYHVRDETKKRKAGVEVTADPGVGDKRILAAEEELAHLFRADSRPGSTLLSVLRQAWDCPHFLRNTTKKDATIATDPYISLLGHMTQEELVGIERTAISNGFLNRCLWFYAARARLVPNPEPVVYSASLKSEFHQALCFALGGGDVDIMALSPEPVLVPLSAQAQEWWNGFHREMTDPREETVGKIVARTPSQIRKVALNYATLDLSLEIEVRHLLAAKAIVDHSSAYAAIIFRSFTPNKLADKILRYLQRKRPEGKTRTEIRKSVTNDHVPAAEIVEALQCLVQDNLVRCEVLRNSQNKAIERWLAK
jgi:hypothetical protein